MKTDILNIIKHPTLSDTEKFNELFDFYKKNLSKDRNFESNFNRLGCTPHQFSKLIYEVKKVYKISDLDVVQHTYSLDETTSSTDEQTIDLVTENDQENDNLNIDNPELNEVPLRKEFKFLNKENCPEEFKILINDKITAYHKMVTGRGALDDPNTPADQHAEIAQGIADADMLNSLIYDELKHYEETGEILGKHEIFSTYNLKKSIENMTAEQKTQRWETIKGSIRVAKVELTKLKKTKVVDIKKISKTIDNIQNLELEKNLIIKSLEKTNI